jgi:hypothetical protein
MLPYWFIFLFPAFFAFIGIDRKLHSYNKFFATKLDFMWWMVVILLTIIAGLRYEVGGDWFNYIRIFNQVEGLSLVSLATAGDPGYLFLNWLGKVSGSGIYGVNFLAGFLFSIGLAIFCRHLPRPFLGLTVAIPYLFVVVSMGYSRQGIALGLSMLGLVALIKKRNIRFVFWIILAATMHKSAIILLPLAAFTSTKNKFLVWTAIALSGLLATFFLVLDSLNHLYTYYIKNPYVSDGAIIRLGMNAIPAAIYLIWSDRFNFSLEQRQIWGLFSIASIIFLCLFFITPASTALDRIALYFLPIQLVILSYLPQTFSRSDASKKIILTGVIFYSGLVLFVWLNFANHSFYWIPYQNYIFINENVLQIPKDGW